MENICVYSQRKVLFNGMQLLVGEDALPFANQYGMFAADGLGGAAGLRVNRIPDALFVPENMAAAICKLMPDCQEFRGRPDCKAAFDAYLKAHFASLCNPNMFNIYRDTEKHVMQLKKSGYIGSHALGAVVAYLLSCMDAIGDDNLLNNAQLLRKEIPSLYKKVIDELGIHYRETNMTRMEPYSSTLSVALYKEQEDGVDAVFLNCGDSRSYVLDMDGLRQAADDQGRNGGMTHLISYKKLAEKGNIEISLEQKHFAKPCILMCVTDGVYSTFEGQDGFGATPMYMEGVLLGQIAHAESYDGLRTSLQTWFDARGGIDDSNSMAMAFFGFADYEAVRAFAQARYAKLQADYRLQEMPKDFIARDYALEYQKMSARFSDGIKDLLAEAFEDPYIKAYCAKQYANERYGGKYTAMLRSFEEKRAEVQNEQDKNNQCFGKLTVNNYTEWIGSDKEPKNGLFSKLSFFGPVDHYKNVREHTQEYRKQRECFEKEREQLNLLRAKYADYLAFVGESQWNDSECLISSEKNLDFQVRIAHGISKMEEALRNGAKMKQQIQKENIDEATERMKRGTDRIDAFIRDRIAKDSVEGIRTNDAFPQSRELFAAALKKRKELAAELVKVNQDLIKATEQAKRSFWMDEGSGVIDELLDHEKCLAENQDLKERIRARLRENEELNQCARIKELQKELFDKYMAVHLREISPESTKHEDVRKNGWH